MHLKIGGTLLSAPPDFDGVQVEEMTDTQVETSLEGMPFQRVASQRYWKLTLSNTQNNGINLNERYALSTYKVGDTITIEENYSDREITVWTGCTITSKQRMPRIIKDASDSSEAGDWFAWGFELIFVEA
ncbi:hypothetical protein [Deinococcus cellulosilyticus]|uniref:Uncharacterized protein n=1 Tax=Deinococcus cellulosilyticus (strain DSM 18568 / NBRC 106333 / KACC 11606 / 5516J-15) TaxID=1223518 RepID=A0A511N0G2_DEIC1|nr:hypothetical protein [Deinococcus cellulosilyticus]GEM45917.1 hypothetical protein DC3_15520 [Deinococcus cellulosilyticus NBRC 106333 = KACC 11606]